MRCGVLGVHYYVKRRRVPERGSLVSEERAPVEEVGGSFLRM